MSQAQSDIVNIEDSISQIDQREIDLRKNFKKFRFQGFSSKCSLNSASRHKRANLTEVRQRLTVNHPVVLYFKM